MELIIENDSDLRQYLPNIMREVKGETLLFDKLRPFLEMAQSWFCRYFVPEEMLDLVPNAPALIAVEAYTLAIPQLDLVLTPNGFATVGTQNLSPASKMRVDRLVAGLIAQRDRLIAVLLDFVPTVVGWTDTPQAAFFGSTLFSDLTVVENLGRDSGSKWQEYLKIHPQIRDAEDSLAEEWFSPELMEHLREANLNRSLWIREEKIVTAIRDQVIRYLKDDKFNARRLADIVNFIRSNPDDFPLWHQSETAKLFNPPVFRNQKKSSGYFF